MRAGTRPAPTIGDIVGADVIFSWQERYYDRIIWNKNQLFNARQYIINNPSKWERDRNSTGQKLKK
jgi:hypothetical protein